VKDSEIIFKIRQRQPSPKLYVIRNTKNKMKIIKLNGRYSMYSEGYKHALRWNEGYCREVVPYEQAMQEMYGGSRYSTGNSWRAAYGSSRSKAGVTPYYIYLRDESMLMMLLLRVKQ
jgi:hypothetical protein